MPQDKKLFSSKSTPQMSTGGRWEMKTARLALYQPPTSWFDKPPQHPCHGWVSRWCSKRKKRGRRGQYDWNKWSQLQMEKDSVHHRVQIRHHWTSPYLGLRHSQAKRTTVISVINSSMGQSRSRHIWHPKLIVRRWRHWSRTTANCTPTAHCTPT